MKFSGVGNKALTLRPNIISLRDLFILILIGVKSNREVLVAILKVDSTLSCYIIRPVWW